MDETNEQDVDLNNEAEDQRDDEVEELEDSTETAKEKPKRTPEEQLAYLEGRTQRLRKKLGLTEPRKKAEPKTGELDTAAYAYLAAKGIEDDEDIEYIHNRMNKWDMSLRDVLKDEDVQTKLKHFKIEREVKAATPGSTRRASAGNIDNVDYWIAKYERTGEYPSDFALKSAVVNAMAEKENPNKPPWM